MEFNLSLALLSLFVFIAGFIDSIAGGGGIITLPSYLNYGLKSELLLGTNKLSSTFGTLIAVIRFFSKIKFPKMTLFFVFIFSITGSFLGAYFISSINPKAIKYMLIVILPAISIFMTLNKHFAGSDSSEIFSKNFSFRLAFISFAISFYDGLFGPGTGTLLAFSYGKFCRYDLLSATALAKFTNLISNISALATFLILGKVDIKLGLLMALVAAAGNFLGANMALKKGASFIRPVLIVISNVLVLKIVYDILK